MKRLTPPLLLLIASLGVSLLGFGCKAPAPASKAITEDPPQSRKFPLSSLKTVSLKIANYSFKAWVMDDEEKRKEGFMFVKPKDVTDDQAMIFMFEDNDKRSFWMQNTEIPLDIAYFDKDRKLITVKSGIPFSREELPSGKPSKYVVETNDGVFERLGIKPGAVLEIE